MPNEIDTEEGSEMQDLPKVYYLLKTMEELNVLIFKYLFPSQGYRHFSHIAIKNFLEVCRLDKVYDQLVSGGLSEAFGRPIPATSLPCIQVLRIKREPPLPYRDGGA